MTSEEIAQARRGLDVLLLTSGMLDRPHSEVIAFLKTFEPEDINEILTQAVIYGRAIRGLLPSVFPDHARPGSQKEWKP